MPGPPLLHDLACVVHLHSTYSDGTGTVAEIAAAGRRAGADVVLLTDHDSLEARRRGEEGWHGPVLLLAGVEVSPAGRNHYLAFGIDEEVEHDGLDAAGICEAVRERGGFGFAAHPFSEGSRRFARRARAMPFEGLDCEALHGIELWSFLNDTLEPLESIAEIARFVVAPGRVVDHPPQRNVRAWEGLCRERRTVALGGLDAHQIGVRVAGRVPLRLMGYARSFRHIRTHVLCEEAPSGELERDRAQVFGALREGRCYIAHDWLAPARGFAFWAAGGSGEVLPMGGEAPSGKWGLEVSAPRPCSLRIVRDGEVLTQAEGARLSLDVTEPGVYRAEAHLDGRTWVISNPVYLR
ncbi:MAG: CehA/McbA family metallohydrolase [Thermoleophilaceae bacterium]